MIRVSEAEGKDPSDIDDFSVDWVNYLRTGETIASQTATSSDVTIVGSVTSSGTLTTARISGGTLGIGASIRYGITTSIGRVLYQTMIVPIRTQ